ncbi:putative tyrosine-protein kinase [Rosellinia necatrix]|uniref:Putative tyrosine-protein kinase n=1 Tax=Rosellinia necatrix TaxID=77044 RepID=A0A1W2TFQ2_ROSNE|nr:putative tyrosine-protein kinase [Rosellinia necatrix]
MATNAGSGRAAGTSGLWLRDFAYHLSWEFWLHDHAAISATALASIYPNGVPDVSPQEAAAQAKEQFYLLRMGQIAAQGKISQDQEYRRAHQRYKYTQITLKQANDWWKKVYLQKSNDTVAVAVCGDDILIAANIKARSYRDIKKGGKGSSSAERFGFYDDRFLERIRQACAVYPQTHQRRVYVLRPKKRPSTVFENAEQHAEMQICRYLRQHPQSHVENIGVSKIACRKCREVMGNKGINWVDRPLDFYGLPLTDFEVDHKLESATITSWLDPDTFDFGDMEAIQVP